MKVIIENVWVFLLACIVVPSMSYTLTTFLNKVPLIGKEALFSYVMYLLLFFIFHLIITMYILPKIYILKWFSSCFSKIILKIYEFKCERKKDIKKDYW